MARQKKIQGDAAELKRIWRAMIEIRERLVWMRRDRRKLAEKPGTEAEIRRLDEDIGADIDALEALTKRAKELDREETVAELAPRGGGYGSMSFGDSPFGPWRIGYEPVRP